ncbi:CRISPR-associated protein Cas1 [Anaeromyxobacter dehalogenans 2CP-1]|uniref:CRISPR-associated endonuclease Cas1 n=1 Tax=Anaeromyxobacter dehalogenans (strain ATCC BAA-258 / DSM 21875 / 2CP-1) TaxID=455488 RepID=B8JDP3_ANAD2|nr:type I-E CRISPR-associated endonuclease Cas1e [Anaeromyxobacter dehalogenans]ACL64138.1 CRISPR-associated protein Cas1 [Anaeromyxobacter dehalogenans 2CP-1]
MLKGRLGLETARIPQGDRHGLLWLSRGSLYVEDGTLRFRTAGWAELPAGDYAIPFQMVTAVLLEPGTTVSHDALRLLARHGTGLVAIGEEGTRFYASMPFGPDASALARRQVMAWASAADGRLRVARRMYAWRFGEVLPDEDITVLRGIEGARMREIYRRLAEQYGVPWSGRRYDRQRPDQNDPVNQAINHAASAVEAAALVAVAVTGTIPQLGFIHEDSGNAFALDVADLFRSAIALPAAFSAVRECAKDPRKPLERTARRAAGRLLQQKDVIPEMIDRIKEMFDADDGHRDP